MSSFDPFPKFEPIPIVFHGYHYDGRQILDDKALMISSSLTTAFGKFINSNVVREWYFNKSLSDQVILKKIKLIMINVLEDRCSRSSTVERNSVTEMITELVDNCQVMVKVGGMAYHEINGTNSFRHRINNTINTTTRQKFVVAFHLVPKRMFRRSITIDFDPFNVSHYTTSFEDSDERQGIFADAQVAVVDLLEQEKEEETETAASVAAEQVAVKLLAQEKQAAAAIEQQPLAFERDLFAVNQQFDDDGDDDDDYNKHRSESTYAPNITPKKRSYDFNMPMNTKITWPKTEEEARRLRFQWMKCEDCNQWGSTDDPDYPSRRHKHFCPAHNSRRDFPKRFGQKLRYWTDEEDAIIIANCATMSFKAISEKLKDRDGHATACRYSILKKNGLVDSIEVPGKVDFRKVPYKKVMVNGKLKRQEIESPKEGEFPASQV